MTEDAMHRGPADISDRLPPETLSIHTTQAWVTIGNVRVTASEWDLLERLITTPSLQTATNADLERMRGHHDYSAVSTDIGELLAKGLLVVHSVTKASRTLRPTIQALAAVNALTAAVSQTPSARR